MRTEIGRDDVQRMAAQGAQIVDVLPEKEYENEHIAGAISLPLTQIDSSTVDRLDRERPVIVYCWDYQ